MSAGITVREDGTAEMLYRAAGGKPWHGMGKEIQDFEKIENCIKEAGIDWDVGLFPVKGSDERDLSKMAMETRRLDNNKTLGVVGPKTHILQNSEAFNWFQPWLDEKAAMIESAGSLDEGRKVWVMALINDADMEIVPGDKVSKYILLSNSHDGTRAVRGGFTPVRVVCQNTLAIAHGCKDSQLIRLRHTKDVKENLVHLREVMNLAKKSFEATEEQYKLLARKDVNENDLRKYVKIVFGMDEDETGMHSKTKNTLERVLGLANNRLIADRLEVIKEIQKKDAEAATEKTLELNETGQGTNLPNLGYNMWRAYNAITEYTSHHSGRTPDNRQDSVWFGPNAEKNAKALALALKYVDKGVFE